jgi:hypothetical protein
MRQPQGAGAVVALTTGPTLAFPPTRQPAGSVSGPPASGARAGAVSREAMRERGAVFRQPARRGESVPAAGRDGVRKPLLGNEGLPNRCSCPSVRAVNRWNLFSVQLLGDLLQ